MRNEKDLVANVTDVHTRNIQARHGLRPANGKQGILEDPEAAALDSAFPYLGQIIVAAKNHPYAMLIGIVTAVGSVLVAIGTLAVITVGGMFSMYGTMREMKAQQATIIDQQATYVNEIKVLRTYEASVLSRQNFIAGLMSAESQQRLNDFDRANPVPQLPPVREPRIVNPDQ